jgi:uncharacterized protein (TIGR03083 family)
MSTTSSSRDDLLRPQIPRPLAMQLVKTEYARMADTLAGLGPDDWTRATDCTLWDVRQLACHMVGMAQMITTPLETKRQQRKAAECAQSQGVDFLTALTGLQVSERSDWTTDDIVAGAQKVGPKALRGRRLIPGFMRKRALPDPQHVNGRDETWALGFMSDVILTRDPWMHRMDIAKAVDAEPVLTPDHDGVIVADVVEEWADRHGQPFALTLTGPAGGSWSRGEEAPTIAMDAIDFCRVISGRGTGEGLLAVQVPF